VPARLGASRIRASIHAGSPLVESSYLYLSTLTWQGLIGYPSPRGRMDMVTYILVIRPDKSQWMVRVGSSNS